MTDIHPLLFEGESLVRIVTRDGEPWFVAADVCRALGLTNPSKVVDALDDDERANFNLGRQGEAHIISESGLYTLILRSRQATTPGSVQHRFRKWVTSEVLPSIRKTGAYVGAPEPEVEAVDPVITDPLPEAIHLAGVPERTARLWMDTIREGRMLFGRAAAVRLWQMSPLPQPSTPAPQPELGNTDAWACLDHLRYAITAAAPMAEPIGAVLAGDESARRYLAGSGLRVAADEIEVSNNHPALTRLFRGTVWAAGWSLALRGLPGAHVTGTRSFKGLHTRATAVPTTLFTGPDPAQTTRGAAA